MIEAYARVGRRDARWDDKVRSFLEVSAPWWTERYASVDARRATALGRELLSLECNDPLVLYAAGMAIAEEDVDSQEATFLLQRAVEGMKEVRYPRAVARYVASGLYRAYDYGKEGVGLRRALAPQELQWFVESLNDGSYRPDDDAVLVWQLMNGSGVDFFKRNKDRARLALDGATWLDEWARLHFSGLWHNYRAWDARGHGVATEVKPEAWKNFAAEAALARRDWVRAWELRPDRYEAAYEMISGVGDAGDSAETPRLWFDRAVAARFDYWPAYDSLLEVQLPRWGGSHEEVLSLGQECLATGRFDTNVPLFLLEAVERIARDQDEMDDGGPSVYERPETFTLLAKMLDGYLAASSPPRSKELYHAVYASVAAKAKRWEVAREHLAAVAYRPARDDLWRIEEQPQDFVGRVAALGGPAGATVLRAEAARETVGSAAALALYREALAQEPVAEAQRFLRHRLTGLLQEQALASGQWADFSPQSDALAGWEIIGGSYRVERDRALLATSGRRGYLLVSMARVGPDFELKTRMEFVTSTNGEYQGGIVFGRPAIDSQDWISFRLKRNHREGQVGYFSQHLYQPWLPPTGVETPGASDVLIRVQDGRLTALVDGKAVAENLEPPQGLVEEADLRVGVGAYLDENQFSIRYRNMRVRRLKSTSGTPPGPSPGRR